MRVDTLALRELPMILIWRLFECSGFNCIFALFFVGPRDNRNVVDCKLQVASEGLTV